MQDFRRWAREAALNNLTYKVLSILIALALWFIVRDERVDEVVTVPLDVQAAAADLFPAGDPPEVVVEVTGTRAALDRLRRSPISQPVKVKATEPGTVTIRLKPEELSFPSGVVAKQVSPPALRVELERRSSGKLLDGPRSDNSTPPRWRTP